MKFPLLSAVLLAVSCNSEEPTNEQPQQYDDFYEQVLNEDEDSQGKDDIVKYTCADGSIIEMKDSTWVLDGECDCPDCSDEDY